MPAKISDFRMGFVIRPLWFTYSWLLNMGRQTCYESQKSILMLLILSGIIFCKQIARRPVSTKDFDFIRKCKMHMNYKSRFKLRG